MFPNHYMDVRLGPGDKSVAYFSRKPKRHLLIFVHGFAGNAVDTWDKMHQLLPTEAAVADFDIVFYGYESTRARALLSAGLLRQFISDLNDPKGKFQTSIPAERSRRRPHTEYTKIVIVAHSLGAALARRAILDAMASNARWVNKTSLILFAPAHKGAYLSKLAGEMRGASKIFAALAALTKLPVPVLDDLAPQSSFVTGLERETRAACHGRGRAPLKASSVIFGLLDKVVEPGRFCHDPASLVWPDRGHVSVCKASTSFRDPLTEILRHI